MRFSLFISVIVLAMGALGPRAEAQNYPWCANYSKDFGGQNCGFSTREQCMVDVSGIGGFCEPNNLYVPKTGAKTAAKTAATTATLSPHGRMRHKSHKNS